MIINPIGVLALARREIHRFVVVAWQTLFPPLVMSILFMYIFGVAIGQRLDFSATGLTYLEFIVPGLMTMHLMSAAYENTSSSLFIARWHNHIQEILLSPLNYFEMVLGLLAGGVMRANLVCLGVYYVSFFFTFISIANPFLLIYFIATISVIFSCTGMMAALWAEDFGMLNIWNIYLIVPLVLIGGVFHPIEMLPETIQVLTKFNPMFYLVQGVRFSVVGVSDVHILFPVLVSGVWAAAFFLLTVYLFKIGYKLRT